MTAKLKYYVICLKNLVDSRMVDLLHKFGPENEAAPPIPLNK